MKVHVYGNTLNVGYYMTQFLRSHGVAAEMFLDDSSSSQQNYPWWEDATLAAEKLPPWIHYHRVKPFFALPDRGTRQMIAEFAACDVALVSGFGPVLATRAKVPFVFYATGSDLNIIGTRLELLTIARSRIPARSRIMRLAFLLGVAPMQAAALKNEADKIMVLMGYQLNPFIKKYGLTAKTVKGRLAWDTLKYATQVDESLNASYRGYDLIFFMIARHSWTSVWDDTKGNDKFIRAFATFAKRSQRNVRLIMIAKGVDVAASQRLVDALGITGYVEWVGEMNKDGVRAFESLPNCVVVDQFWHDKWYRKYPEDRARPVLGFGSGSIEALSAGRPLITMFTDEAFYEDASPPILSAFTEQEIVQRLVQVHDMTPEERREMGEAGRAFVYKWHDWRNVTPMYVDVLRAVMKARRRTASTTFEEP